MIFNIYNKMNKFKIYLESIIIFYMKYIKIKKTILINVINYPKKLTKFKTIYSSFNKIFKINKEKIKYINKVDLF